MSSRTRASSPSPHNYLRLLPDVPSILGGTPAMNPISVNRVYTTPVQVPFTLTVNAVCFEAGTVAGNVRVGIYRDNGDTPTGGALIVQSGIVVVPAGINAQKEIAIANTRLTPGLYWICATFDDVGQAVQRMDTRFIGSGTLSPQYYGSAPLNPLVNPYPAGILTDSRILWLRVASVP